ncbi:YheC/YheD family endospore coat-associated protein [Paenibacillus koleovorans]|uniref:YheC/YheD family endospore coat-associated protein n=1 Tax=Paenibacillus koleovorans TaxID=121608 RepID=UPI000FDAE0AD|nr:YheC/YheD family protein [Paenibacillus koleovorans]
MVDVSETYLQRPLVGILTMHDSEEQFRGNRANFIDLIRTGYEMGVSICVITMKDLKPRNKRIIAHVYNVPSDSWSQQWIAVPHVLYNRIPSRSDEESPDVQQTLQACMRNPQIRLFNPSYFDKWTLFEWLNKGKHTAKYIPLTRKMTNAEELETLLRTFPVLYLKPVRGKAGQGIMRVRRAVTRPLRKTEFRLSVQGNRASQLYKTATVSQLWTRVQEEMENGEYIVQQGITLARHKRRKFDLRLLVQKNGKGEWKLTGIGARLAGKMSITTHVPRGGSIDDPEKLLASTFGWEGARRILLRAKRAALTIARQIEKKSGHLLGEMSMDMGVDTSGSIWFFEANSKPMKFDEPPIRKKSLQRIVQYSLHLIRSKQAKAPGTVTTPF